MMMTVLLSAPMLGAEAFYNTNPSLPTAAWRVLSSSSTQLGIFGGGGGAGKIPSSPSDRDQQAISAVKAAIANPKTRGYPLIECEFPPLTQLNKLGDGSMRSANEVDQANLAFCAKLIKSIAPLPLLGPKTWVLTSSSSSTKAFISKVQSALKGTGAVVESLRNNNGILVPDGIAKGDVCLVLAPTARTDYRAAQFLAESNSAKAVVIINGLAKDQESVSGKATMAYYLKPLTYNSQIAGYCIRSYPGPWTVLDAATKTSLGTFDDADILFGASNTPDLRSSGRLVQKATDERAIAARRGRP